MKRLDIRREALRALVLLAAVALVSRSWASPACPAGTRPYDFKWGNDLHQGCALSLRSDGSALWHGPYRLRSGSGNVLEGEYVDNKKQGIWREYFANGNKRSEGAYDHDLPTGEHRRWDDKGRLLEVSHYRAGVRDGAQTTFFENGQRQSETSFELGKQIGLSREWYADGTRKSECHYQAGQMHGRCTTWHANGKIAGEGEFERGQPRGVWTQFHANGKKSVQGSYVAGRKQGSWTQWDESGTRRLVEEYEGDFKLESAAWDAAGRPVVEAFPAGLRQCDRAPELELGDRVSLSSLRGKKPALILSTPPPEPFLTTLRKWSEQRRADVEVVLFCSVYYGDAFPQADPAATCRAYGFPVRIVATSMAGREPPPKDIIAWRAGGAMAYVVDAQGKIAYRGDNLRDLPDKLEHLFAGRSPCSAR